MRPYDRLGKRELEMLSRGEPAEIAGPAFAKFFETFSGLGALPRHAQDWVLRILSNDNLILNVPSRHAKTTILEWFAIWTLARNRQSQILWLSRTQDLAERSCRRIAWNLEYNSALIDAYGLFRPLERDWPWRPESGELMVVGRERLTGTGDFSLQARGSRQQILGMEATLVVADDVGDRRVAESEVERGRQLEWFTMDALSRLMPDGRAIVLGQRVHQFDLYGLLLEPEEGEDRTVVWEHEVTPAVLQWPDESKGIEPIVLWPEQRPFEWLMKQRRRLRITGFEAMFQQSPPSAEGDLIVREEWVQKCLDDRDIGQSTQIPGARVRVVSCDPGLTKFSAVIVADLIYEARTSSHYLVEVLDIRREYDLGNENLVMLLADLQKQYSADVLIFETNSLKAQRRDSNWDWLRNLFPFVVEHNTGMNKKDEQLGAAMSRSLWEFGRLRLPWGSLQAREAVQPLIDEGLRRIPTDDLLMSLWFIYYRALGVRYYGPGQLPTRFNTGSVFGGNAWKGWGGMDRSSRSDPAISWPLVR